MSKHTPGPWIIDWNISRLDVFSADAATLVATIRRSTLSAGLDDVAKANARLIAAAPETAAERDRLREVNAELLAALRIAEAALSDIGDADREPGDDVAWCEQRAAQAIPIARTALARKEKA